MNSFFKIILSGPKDYVYLSKVAKGVRANCITTLAFRDISVPLMNKILYGGGLRLSVGPYYLFSLH